MQGKLALINNIISGYFDGIHAWNPAPTFCFVTPLQKKDKTLFDGSEDAAVLEGAWWYLASQAFGRI